MATFYTTCYERSWILLVYERQVHKTNIILDENWRQDQNFGQKSSDNYNLQIQTLNKLKCYKCTTKFLFCSLMRIGSENAFRQMNALTRPTSHAMNIITSEYYSWMHHWQVQVKYVWTHPIINNHKIIARHNYVKHVVRDWGN